MLSMTLLAQTDNCSNYLIFGDGTGYDRLQQTGVTLEVGQSYTLSTKIHRNDGGIFTPNSSDYFPDFFCWQDDDVSGSMWPEESRYTPHTDASTYSTSLVGDVYVVEFDYNWDIDATCMFELSVISNPGALYVDYVHLESEGVEVLQNADFDEGTLHWQTSNSDVQNLYSNYFCCDEINTCIEVATGCANSAYQEYNPLAVYDDGSCETLFADLYEEAVFVYGDLMSDFNNSHYEHYGPISIDLTYGWNLIAYTLNHDSPVIPQFEPIKENLEIVKNNSGEVYWPAFDFTNMASMEPGQGYQVKMTEAAQLDFQYINDDNRLVHVLDFKSTSTPLIGQIHPNDIRTIVKIIDLFGEEVDSETYSSSEPVLYLYNDGTVEKKILKK